MSGDSSDVEFMMNRCLGISLTDAKRSLRDGESITFDFCNEKHALSNVYYEPLAKLIHNARFLKSFQTDVISSIRKLAAVHSPIAEVAFGAEMDPDVDSDQDQIWGGARLLPRMLDLRDGLVCVGVSEEFLSESTSIVSFFKGAKRSSLNKNFLEVLDHFADAFSALDQEWTSVCMKLGEVCCKLALKIRGEFELGNSDAIASATLEDCFRRGIPGQRLCSRLLQWRDHWKTCVTGLHPGGRFRLAQNRRAPSLYEIWCFIELANAFQMCGFPKLVQKSVLRGGSTSREFADERRFSVYYDFYGSASGFRAPIDVLRGIHVEWLFFDKQDPINSVIIDTKYKEVETKDVFAVLGYLLEFQFRRGVIFTPQEFDPGRFDRNAIDRRFVIHKIPGGNGEVVVVCLSPKEKDLDRNRESLERLVFEFFCC